MLSRQVISEEFNFSLSLFLCLSLSVSLSFSLTHNHVYAESEFFFAVSCITSQIIPYFNKQMIQIIKYVEAY